MLSILAVLLFFCSIPLHAQLNIGGEPYSFKNNLEDRLPEESMPPIDLVELEREDEIDESNGLPPRFGYGFDTELNLENSGDWTQLENGDRIWRLMIECSGASSINLTYDWFWIPEGAVFHIYSPDKLELLGGFTSHNNKGTKAERKGFATSFIKKDQIILEYYEPARVAGEGVISINKVVHGYRGITNNRVFGESGSCNVNINCPEASDYQDEKRAVALVVVNGVRWCTGALMANTCENYAPLFLTADHCFDVNGQDAITAPNDPTLLFLWNYESSSCSNGSDFTPPSTAGALMVANDTPSDFALLSLTENPSNLLGVNPFYLGWDRTGYTPEGGVGIHHPRGDIKKFCEEEDNLTSTAYLDDSEDLNGNHWRVDDWDVGVTEGGSSGSPLMYRGTNRVVGQLHGGQADCDGSGDNGDPDWYGKLSVSWYNGGVSDSRRKLYDWLDPCQTGAWIMDGKEGYSGCSADIYLNGIIIGSGDYEASNSISSSGTVPSTADVTFDAGSFIFLSDGFNVEAGGLFFAHIAGCPGLGGSPGPELNFSNNQSAVNRLEQLSDKELELAIKNYPNPFSNNTTFEFELNEATPVRLEIYNISGQLITTLVNNEVMTKGIHTIDFKVKNMQDGIYLYRFSTEKETITQKMILSR